jgi:two-component system NarL family sensor kinase
LRNRSTSRTNPERPVDIELTLYLIFEEALRNAERHAHARHVTVYLRQPGAFVQLVVKDDGIGFDPDHRPARRKGPAPGG